MTTQTILLIEDDEDQRAMLEAVLRRCAQKVVSVGTPTEALKMIEGQTFDVVVTDFRLPDFDGVTLAQRIRNSGGQNQDVPVVVLSAADIDEVLKINSSLIQCVVKKNDLTTLISEIKQLLSSI